MEPVFAVADDLTGAVECAWSLGAPPLHAAPTVVLDARHHQDSADSVVVDANTRAADEHTTARVVFGLLNGAGRRRRFVKIDSALRGNVRGTIVAAAQLGPVVVTPALPALGRTTRAGVVLAHGEPLSDDLVTSVGERPRLASLLDAVPEGAQHLHLDVVQLRSPDAPVVLDRAMSRCTVVTVDAETDADLDLVAGAVAAHPDATLVGSAGLSAALARTAIRSDPTRPHAITTPPGATADAFDLPLPTGPMLHVVGSRSPAARRQVAALPSAVRIVIPDRVTSGSAAARVRTELAAGRSVVLASPDDEADADAVRQALAEAAADGVASSPGTTLVLVGGQTAREVCERLGIDALRPLRSIGYGTVLCHDTDERAVILRPGSFGDDDDLAVLHRRLTSPTTTNHRENTTP